MANKSLKILRRSRRKSLRRRSRRKSLRRRSRRKSLRRSRRRKSLRKSLRRSLRRSFRKGLKRSRRRSLRRSRRRSLRRLKQKKNCIKRSNLPLRDLQKKVVNFISKPGNEALLVVHSTGCGKTLTAVTASQCFLDKDPLNKIVFISPPSLIDNFKKELINYGIEDFSRYEFYTYTGFMNLYKQNVNFNFCKNSMFILDEVHNLRNYVKTVKKTGKEKTGKEKTARYLSAFFCSIHSSKRLLLTATPFINNLTDFIPIINIMEGGNAVGSKTEYTEGKVNNFITSGKLNDNNIKVIKKYLNKKVDYVSCKGLKGFPKLEEHYQIVKMPKKYEEKYLQLLAQEQIDDIVFKYPDAFYNAQRRIVNTLGKNYYSTKIKAILDKLEEKSIIYTNWLDFGVNPIKNFLKTNNISYEVFTGNLSLKQRKKIVEDFNNGDFKVLIITKAGGEGLDLKGVRNVIVLDPVWHDSGLKQIIGRAVRYLSHAHLPKDEQKVDVWKLILVEKSVKNWEKDPTISGDAILYRIIMSKKEINNQIIELLKSISI